MAAETPNVLLLLTDQERYDLTDPDGPAVETPSIDGLAEEGATFERAYTPIGICTSARASLLTGVYPHAHGMLNNYHSSDAIRSDLADDRPTFGPRLREAGYAVTAAGKWHVGRERGPESFGFRPVPQTGSDGRRVAFHEHQRACGVDPEGVELRDAIVADYGDAEILVSAETTVPPEATWTHFLVDRTIEHLERLASVRKPFFHRTDFEGPHHPYVVPEPYASLYDPDEIELWGNAADPFDGKPHVHEQFRAYRGVDGFDRDTWAEAISKYFGFVTFVDEQIGRILDALDALDLAAETVTIHAADHGDMTGSHGQFNKGPAMYEEVYHVPLHVRWPGVVEAGSRRTEFVHLHDLMPTFLDLADLDPPAEIDARSLRPLLEDDAPDDWRDSAFAEYHGDEFGLYSQRMVRTERYKLVYNAFDVNELYDLEADPFELENLIDRPEYRDARRELLAELERWMERTDDPIYPWTKRAFARVRRRDGNE